MSRKKVFVEVEKKVPIVEVEWVDREVQVPHIQFQDKVVFQEHVKEVIKQVPVKEIIEVPVEKVREIPRIEKIEVIQTVVKQGEDVICPLPYLVDQRVVIPKFNYQLTPTVVAQTARVSIIESEIYTVDLILNEYIPKLVPQDVFVPTPVTSSLIATKAEEKHVNVKLQTVPAPQWNSIMKDLNVVVYKNSRADYSQGRTLADGFMYHISGESQTLSGKGSFAVPPTEKDFHDRQAHSQWWKDVSAFPGYHQFSSTMKCGQDSVTNPSIIET